MSLRFVLCRLGLAVGLVTTLAVGCVGELETPDPPQDDDEPGLVDGGIAEGPDLEVPVVDLDAGKDAGGTDAGTGTEAGAPPPKGPLADYDAARGKKLADKAYALWNGKKAAGTCLKGVRISAESSGIIPTPPGWTRFSGAYQWGEWANSHPADLAKIGFRRVTGLGTRGIPQGSVIVWQRGQCGYSKTWGHIEIVVDTASSRACSDFCGKVSTCAEPWTYIPVKL